MLRTIYKRRIERALKKADEYYAENYNVLNSSSFYHSLENNKEYFIFYAKLKSQKFDGQKLSSCIFISRDIHDLSVGNIIEDIYNHDFPLLNLGATIKYQDGMWQTIHPGYSNLFEYAKALHRLSQEERFQSNDENAIKMKQNIIISAKKCVVSELKKLSQNVDSVVLGKNLKKFEQNLKEDPLDRFIDKYESIVYFLNKYQTKTKHCENCEEKNL